MVQSLEWWWWRWWEGGGVVSESRWGLEMGFRQVTGVGHDPGSSCVVPYGSGWLRGSSCSMQYPLAVAHTLAESQSMLCWCFWMWTAMPFCMSPVFIAYLCSVTPLLHASLGFTNILHFTVTAWNFIDNFFLLLHWGLHFHLH